MGVWPVWEAEAGVSFFHLFFELLNTVQEGHHSMIKLIVPEEPQATWAVQRKFLDTKRQEKKLKFNHWNYQRRTGEGMSLGVTFDLSVSDSK